MRFAGPVYDAIVTRLARGAASATDLVADSACGVFGRDRLAEGIKMLALAGQVVRCSATAR